MTAPRRPSSKASVIAEIHRLEGVLMRFPFSVRVKFQLRDARRCLARIRVAEERASAKARAEILREVRAIVLDTPHQDLPRLRTRIREVLHA